MVLMKPGFFMKTPPTMQQIADVAGVSRMTVSLAMRNSADVSAALGERIRAIAKEMGYRPNPLVSALMAQRAVRKSQGAIYPLALINSVGNEFSVRKTEFYGAMISGIEERCLELGFHAEMFSLQSDSEVSSDRLHRILRARGIRGAIVLPVKSNRPILDFPWEHYSASTLGHTLHQPALNRAASDQYMNAWTALEGAEALGYRRPGLLLSQDANVRTNYQYAAAYLAFQRYRPKIASIPPCHHAFMGDGKTISTWLKRYDPDVVLSVGDSRSDLTKLGFSVPRDIGTINLNLTESQKDISGIDPLIPLVGRASVDLVVALMHRNESGPPLHPRTTLVAGQWKVGKTTRPPA